MIANKNFKNTITITFGDQAENHVGMQKIGELADEGFSTEELIDAKKLFENKGYLCEIIELNTSLPQKKKINTEKATILIVRKGVDCLLQEINQNCDNLYSEQNNLEVDKKAKMYGRIVEKHARHNLCFDVTSQEPNYDTGKGRIIAYSQVPLTNKIRDNLPNYLGNKANNLCAEGNYYFDIKKCGIGFHGDSERRKVIAIRLGATIPLEYQWFYKGEPVGKRIKLTLNHGDLYVMSDKSTGHDWKKKNIYTLRHAAGSKKFLTIKKKKKIIKKNNDQIIENKIIEDKIIINDKIKAD